MAPQGRVRFEDSPELRAQIREGLLDTYFQTYDPHYLASPAGQADIENHVVGRYEMCLQLVLPWVTTYIDLVGARVVEVGCGTGSSTAGFAWDAERVDGYDIDEPSIEGAEARIQSLGLDNVGLHLAPTESILDLISSQHQPGSVDVVLLYAVLEHQTLDERLRCIEISWELLRDGGLLVVVETPNRLALWDYHTSLLPFFHALPDELALRYFEHSPREPFRTSLGNALAVSKQEALLTLTRWGRGVGSHEFEVVLGDLEPLIVASGYEEPMTAWFPVQFEDQLLCAFFAEKDVRVPIAFTRHVLNFILRKGGRMPADAPARPIASPMMSAARLRELTELREAYASLESSPGVRLVRQLDRVPRIRRLAAAGWRRAVRVREAWRP